MANLPPQISVAEPGSFAEFTLRERLPDILHDMMRLNTYPEKVVERLHGLEIEMRGGTVQPFVDDGLDTAFWAEQWQRWRTYSWQQLPWFWAETFFYRRLLAATEYFQPGAWQHRDPFITIKRDALQLGLARLRLMLDLKSHLDSSEECAYFWLLSSLWSNRSDFSNRAALELAKHTSERSEEILVDDRESLYWAFCEQDLSRLDIVCDNAGPELLTDLALADWLLHQRFAAQVVLQLKMQPYYVSDAMPEDVCESITALQTYPDDTLAELGARLKAWLDTGHLVLQAHPFWVSSLTLFEIPRDLLRDLSASNLLICKGDVNYRRLLDDRHWPFGMPLGDIPNQVPVNYTAIRAIKSEIACGLDPDKVAQLERQDSHWMIDGRWGLIQYTTRSLLH